MAFLAVIGGGALALDVSRLPAVEVQVGVLDLGLAIVAATAVTYVQGLPGPIARYVGIGRRSREWEFDRRLHVYRKKLDAALLRYPSSRDWPAYRDWQSRVLRDGHRHLAGMRGLHPPDDEWAESGMTTSTSIRTSSLESPSMSRPMTPTRLNAAPRSSNEPRSFA